MKNIVIIGAGTFIGGAILKEALFRGNRVKAIIGENEKIPVFSSKVQVVYADVLKEESLYRHIIGNDSVISAFRCDFSNPNVYQETLDANIRILESLRKANVKRYHLVGTSGSLMFTSKKKFLETSDFPQQFLACSMAMDKFYEDILKYEKEVDWVYLCPSANIHFGQRTEKFRIGTDAIMTDENGVSAISVEDYAVALLDDLDLSLHHRETFTVGY